MGDDGCLTWTAGHGLADGFVAASMAQRVRPGEGVIGQALATQTPARVDDLRHESRFLRRELAIASGYEALWCVPVMAQTKAVGTLQLYGSAVRHLSPEILPLLQATSEQLAVAIANAHLRSRR